MRIADQLQQLLSRGIAGNQKQLVKTFADIGVITTQSSVSRALKKINAVKSMDDSGNTIYTLQTSASGQQIASPPSDLFESLVHGIEHNGHLIVVHTKPGTAMTVAKFIDDKKFEQIMGYRRRGRHHHDCSQECQPYTHFSRPYQILSKQYRHHVIIC